MEKSEGNASVEGCQEGSHRSGQGFQGIASFQYREDRLLPGSLPQQFADRREPCLGHLHPTERIIAVGVEAGGDHPRSGCDDREDVLEPRGDCAAVRVIVGTSGQRVVPRKATAGADPISSPAPVPG